MIQHDDVVQGSPEWHTLRLGKPTASAFHRIISPGRLKLSSQRHTYLAELIVERQTGRPYDVEATQWMGRGTQLEDEARKWYEFDRGEGVRQTGFVTNDAGTIGGSPDGLVGRWGLIEIKCRSRRRHIEVVLGHAEPASRTQVQGLLWLTQARWCDVVQYCPGMGGHVDRFERDDEAITAISQAVFEFTEELADAMVRLTV